jgi:hypothetical protein
MRQSSRTGLLNGVFIVVLTILLFILMHSMVHHRFFSGGPYPRHDSAFR